MNHQNFLLIFLYFVLNYKVNVILGGPGRLFQNGCQVTRPYCNLLNGRCLMEWTRVDSGYQITGCPFNEDLISAELYQSRYGDIGQRNPLAAVEILQTDFFTNPEFQQKLPDWFRGSLLESVGPRTCPLEVCPAVPMCAEWRCDDENNWYRVKEHDEEYYDEHEDSDSTATAEILSHLLRKRRSSEDSVKSKRSRFYSH